MRAAGPPPWPPDDVRVRAALERAFAERSWGRYHGPNGETLVQRLAEYHGCREVVLCSSGTAAVELALRGLKIGGGDEVILAAYDFQGNFRNVLSVGAVPVLVDVHPDNWNFDPSVLERAATPRTRAIIVSHLHGGVVPMPAVLHFARRTGLAVIEDACQMPGAEIDGRKTGTWGDVGVLSFGGSKLVSAGRGGALLTDQPEIVQRARLYSHRGNEAYPLSELQAAVLIPQLESLDQRNRHRAENVARLLDLISGIGLRPFRNSLVDCGPGYYKVGFQYEDSMFQGLPRDHFAAAMRAEGIAFDAGFRALHVIHSARRYRKTGALRHASQADRQALTLHHPVLLEDADSMAEIAAAVEKIRTHAARIRTLLENQPAASASASSRADESS